MTYTHTDGKRNRMLEFSNSILKQNKPAGILVRLDAAGVPEIKGTDDLTGKTIADVRGWAPTDDGLGFVKNTCTGKIFGKFKMLVPEESGNDVAMRLMMEKTDGVYKADGVWLYADQAKNFNSKAAEDSGKVISWDKDIWDQFGKPNGFAYIHVGMMDHAINGTTLVMSRKGSGLNDIVNPCIQEFMKTKEYYDICKDFDFVDHCYANDHFDSHSGPAHPADAHWFTPTKDLTTTCSDGYCPCSG